MAGQGRAGQGRAEQGRAGQDRSSSYGRKYYCMYRRTVTTYESLREKKALIMYVYCVAECSN